MHTTPDPKSGVAEERRGGAFYDEPGVFERYQLHRRWPLNPNLVMEEPALFEELGVVSGLRVLDLGCGDAAIGPVLLAAGAARYLGVDGSARMVRAAARRLCDITGVERCDIEEFAAAPGSFDALGPGPTRVRSEDLLGPGPTRVRSEDFSARFPGMEVLSPRRRALPAVPASARPRRVRSTRTNVCSRAWRCTMLMISVAYARVRTRP